MDENKSSFLYLPSNVARQRYASNTPSHFKIPLAEPPNFRDPNNWEVSLSELYFPSSYYNISQDNNSNLTIQYHIKGVVLLYTSGPVSLKERLLYTLNKLFVKQAKSCLLLLDLDPFILQCSLHNIKYIKFTSPQDISI